MAGYWTEWAKEIAKEVQKKCDKVSAQAELEIGKKADKYAFKIVIPEAIAGVEGAYKDAVAAWYGAYAPKKYSRAGSLYNYLDVTASGENRVAWHISESMSKPRWDGGSQNIYGMVFMSGSHGNTVYGHQPVHTTPIPVYFTDNVEDVEDMANARVQELGQAYFDEHFSTRCEQLFNM